MKIRAPQISVKLVDQQGRGYTRYSAACGAFYGYANDPYKAAAMAIGRLLKFEPWWWTRKTLVREWRGAQGRFTTPIERHQYNALEAHDRPNY